MKKIFFVAMMLTITVAVLLSCGGGKTVISAPSDIDNNTFVDARDGKIYRMVTIGSQTRMAENLNYQADSSWCYDNDDAKKTLYLCNRHHFILF